MKLLKSRKTKLSILLVLTLSIVFTASYLCISATQATAEPQLKIHARVTGGVCEFWGTNPNKREGDWVICLVTTTPLQNGLNGITNNDIAWISQFETGKNGSFKETCHLITDRISNKSKVYIYMNSEGMTKSEPVVCDILPVSGTVAEVQTGSLKVGMDVYEMNSPLLTSDNVLDSIKDGGTQLFYKLGNNWYDLLNDKCTNSNYLVPVNALSGAELEAVMWGKYYKGGETSPTYFQ